MTTMITLAPKTVNGIRNANIINRNWYVLSRVKFLIIRAFQNTMAISNYIILTLIYDYKNYFP